MQHADQLCNSIEAFVKNGVKTHQEGALYVLLPDSGCFSLISLTRYFVGSFATILLESNSTSSATAAIIALQIELAFGTHWLRYDLPWDPAGNLRERVSQKFRLLDTSLLGNEIQALQFEMLLNLKENGFSSEQVLKLINKLNKIQLEFSNRRLDLSSSTDMNPVYELMCVPIFYLLEVVNQTSDTTGKLLKRLVKQVSNLRQIRVLLRAVDSLRATDKLAYDIAPVDFVILSSIYGQVNDIESVLFGTRDWSATLEMVQSDGFSSHALSAAMDVLKRLEEVLSEDVVSTLETFPNKKLVLEVSQLFLSV